MPNIDPLTYIKAALARDYQAQIYRQQKPAQAHYSLIITISRDYGALGEAVAEGLARVLGIQVYDREVLELMGKKAHTDPHFFAIHDEQTQGGFGSFLYGLVSGNPATMQEYRRHLGEALLELARHDCIIIGRGAHLILSGPKLFRVRVVGSRAVCARRIAEESNIPLEEAEKQVLAVNHKRDKALVDMYGETIEHCSLEHADNFDLVINTDHIPVAVAVELVLLALRSMGHLPDGAGRRA